MFTFLFSMVSLVAAYAVFVGIPCLLAANFFRK